MTFLWGASTAPHHVEGNNIHADWWEIENTPGVPFPDRSGDALDSFHRSGEDMRLLAGAGLNAAACRRPRHLRPRESA
jgi:beta-glucosidase